MKLIGIVRLGRDAEVRYTPSGAVVCSFSGAFNYGRKAEGQAYRPSQWVEFSLWGDRAEKLVDYLVKGQVVEIVGGDPHIEVYERREGGTGSKLVVRVDDLELVGGQPEAASTGAQEPAPRQPSQAAAQRPATAQQRAAAPRSAASGTGFDDMDDDIPF